VQRSAVESEGSHFYTLSRAVSELCDKIPVPDPLPAFRYAVLHGAGDEEAEQLSVPQSTPVTVSSDIYKYRSSRKERAFVPQLPTAPLQPTDFLSLDVAPATTCSKATCSSFADEPLAVQEQAEGRGSQVRCKRAQFHYQPLRLKQTVPNPRKIRKKQLKRMRK
jgi:hypothetical protein